MFEEYKNDDYYENFLYNLVEPNYTIVINCLKKINYNLPKNESTKQGIAPVVSYILRKLLNPEETFQIFIKNPESRKQAIDSLNIIDIINELDHIYFELLPISLKYFQYSDMQAELTLLYCNNYIHHIINKFKQHE
jgi:hypothetical protein